MTAFAIIGMGLTGLLRMTWVHDNLAHVLDHSQADETFGTWTGLACPGHGLALSADVDNATLRHLAAGSEIADLIWDAPTSSPPTSALQWTRLAVLETRDGGLFDATGTVQFRAMHVQRGKRGVLAETNMFVRQDGHWTASVPLIAGEQPGGDPGRSHNASGDR